MQFTTIALSLFAAVAAAQSNSGNSTDDSLSGLVAQLPTCAIGCLESSAEGAGCGATDFSCLCSKREFVTNIGACVLLGNTCSDDEIKRASGLANEICTDVRENPDPSEVSKASNLVSSALATSTATATDEPDAAARPDVAFGILGAGFLAALAL